MCAAERNVFAGRRHEKYCAITFTQKLRAHSAVFYWEDIDGDRY
jgi:hypothetical protein